MSGCRANHGGLSDVRLLINLNLLQAKIHYNNVNLINDVIVDFLIIRELVDERNIYIYFCIQIFFPPGTISKEVKGELHP